MPTGYHAVHERVHLPLEVAAVRPVRARVLAEARGDVLEIGGGTGENLALYDTDAVRGVRLIGPDTWTRPVLERRAREAAVPVEIVDGLLPATRACADTVVISFLLCALPDRHGLLTAVRHALREDGRLLFIEHTPTRLSRSVIGDLTALLWRAATTGCDLKCDPLDAVRRAGFVITDMERFTMPTFQLPVRSCVAAIAR